ncbi:MAG: hypothetical protein M3Q93_02830 [Gemmatimonadota bacterium]|nr:hypothetical protein [Gemmatimonadales bacterium]MDQ3136504.1 hypothetical protein [Gemmatimonadota bacterium]
MQVGTHDMTAAADRRGWLAGPEERLHLAERLPGEMRVGDQRSKGAYR